MANISSHADKSPLKPQLGQSLTINFINCISYEMETMQNCWRFFGSIMLTIQKLDVHEHKVFNIIPQTSSFVIATVKGRMACAPTFCSINP